MSICIRRFRCDRLGYRRNQVCLSRRAGRLYDLQRDIPDSDRRFEYVQVSPIEEDLPGIAKKGVVSQGRSESGE